MRMPYLPSAHRFIDAYQRVADDLGEMLGISGCCIWHNFRGWCLGIRHSDGPIEEVEALWPFETPDPKCEGLAVTDEDLVGIREMLFDGPAFGADDASSERSRNEELQADHDEMRDIRRHIGKRLGATDPYWNPASL